VQSSVIAGSHIAGVCQEAIVITGEYIHLRCILILFRCIGTVYWHLMVTFTFCNRIFTSVHLGCSVVVSVNFLVNYFFLNMIMKSLRLHLGGLIMGTDLLRE
jgi:hypothetical protein